MRTHLWDVGSERSSCSRLGRMLPPSFSARVFQECLKRVVFRSRRPLQARAQGRAGSDSASLWLWLWLCRAATPAPSSAAPAAMNDPFLRLLRRGTCSLRFSSERCLRAVPVLEGFGECLSAWFCQDCEKTALSSTWGGSSLPARS